MAGRKTPAESKQKKNNRTSAMTTGKKRVTRNSKKLDLGASYMAQEVIDSTEQLTTRVNTRTRGRPRTITRLISTSSPDPLHNNNHTIQAPTSTENTILAMLTELSDSQKALAARIDGIEAGVRVSNHRSSNGDQGVSATQQGWATSDDLPTDIIHGPPNDLPQDLIIPLLQTLRSNTMANNAADVQMTRLQATARDTCQGKLTHRVSGHYNTREIPGSDPQVRWPNEGVAPTGGAQRLKYDELSIPQWVAGEISNLLQVEDSRIQRYMLLQVRNSMRDAMSLPWSVVRSAFAMSMHEIEEGRLTWADHLTWSMNRMETSQALLLAANTANTRSHYYNTRSQAHANTHHKKHEPRICNYYSEGYCNRQQDHGIYLHKCGYCSELRNPPGSIIHPEAYCPVKYSAHSSYGNYSSHPASTYQGK